MGRYISQHDTDRWAGDAPFRGRGGMEEWPPSNGRYQHPQTAGPPLPGILKSPPPAGQSIPAVHEVIDPPAQQAEASKPKQMVNVHGPPSPTSPYMVNALEIQERIRRGDSKPEDDALMKSWEQRSRSASKEDTAKNQLTKKDPVTNGSSKGAGGASAKLFFPETADDVEATDSLVVDHPRERSRSPSRKNPPKPRTSPVVFPGFPVGLFSPSNRGTQALLPPPGLRGSPSLLLSFQGSSPSLRDVLFTRPRSPAELLDENDALRRDLESAHDFVETRVPLKLRELQAQISVLKREKARAERKIYALVEQQQQHGTSSSLRPNEQDSTSSRDLSRRGRSREDPSRGDRLATEDASSPPRGGAASSRSPSAGRGKDQKFLDLQREVERLRRETGVRQPFFPEEGDEVDVEVARFQRLYPFLQFTKLQKNW